MENIENYLDFISSENYKHQIEIWQRANNISREKIELFYDFVISLYDVIDGTYLGPDVLQNTNDQIGHFKWCWNKIIENFNEEKIYFKLIGSHYNYLWFFFHEAYYLTQVNGNQITINLYFNKLFNFTNKKTRSELDILTELYKILEENLKK